MHNDISDRISIEHVIGRDVTLEPRFDTFTGQCPHCQNTPDQTLTIFPSSQTFHCSACEYSGDVFTWLMDQHNMTMKQAVRQLALMAGVKLR
jgi:DNA primase